MSIDLIAATLDVVLLLVAAFMFLRMYFSNQRIERSVAALHRAFSEDTAARQRHIELMRIELEALSRTKQKLDSQVMECKA